MGKTRTTSPGPDQPPPLLHLRSQAGRLGGLTERLTEALATVADVPVPTGAKAVLELDRIEGKPEELVDQAEALAAQPDLPFEGGSGT
jgi:hypothetical protein